MDNVNPLHSKPEYDITLVKFVRQNRQNEREAGRGGKSPRENGEGDPHNETAMSEVSGDITLDSIRDHMSATLRSEGGDGVAATSTEVDQSTVGFAFSDCIIIVFLIIRLFLQGNCH